MATTITTWTSLLNPFLGIFTQPCRIIFMRLTVGWILCTVKRTVHRHAALCRPGWQTGSRCVSSFFPGCPLVYGPTLEEIGAHSGCDVLSNRPDSPGFGRYPVSSLRPQDPSLIPFFTGRFHRPLLILLPTILSDIRGPPLQKISLTAVCKRV